MTRKTQTENASERRGRRLYLFLSLVKSENERGREAVFPTPPSFLSLSQPLFFCFYFFLTSHFFSHTQKREGSAAKEQKK